MKKKIFLLASVAMGVALVGGTFASWAVTDNADPFSIKVSTGKISTDDTEYVTLSWGSQKSMSSVSNLGLDTIRKAGVLDLWAETASDSYLDGTLSLSVAGGELLKTKLHVDVYAGDLAATDGVIAPETLAGKTPLVFDGEGKTVREINAGEHNLYTVAVYLDSSTTAEDLENMSAQQATLTFDFGPGETDILDALTLYATGFSSTPYVYAWNNTGKNGEFPGVQMKAVEGRPGIYTAQVDVEYTKVIFTTSDESQKSGDIDVAASFGSTYDLFTFDGTTGDAKGTFSKLPEAKTPDYYLVGDEWGNWDASALGAIHLTSPVAGVYTVDITNTAENAQFKIVDVANNIWYSEHSSAPEAGNFILGEIHTYTITFNPAGPTTFISCVIKGA